MTGPRPERPRLLHLATVDMSLALLLGPQLAAFHDAGYEVIGAAAPGPYRERIEATGTRFIPLRHATRAMRPHRDLLALVELVRLFRRLRPDIVHTHNPKPGWYGRLAARIARVPHVVNTVHGLYALPEDPRLKRTIVYTLERLAARCSDAELVQNPEDTETLRGLGVPDSKLHDLGNGIDLDRFAPTTVDPTEITRVRNELLGRSPDSTDPEPVLVGVVGRLVWEKGLQEILDAGTQLRETHPDVQIVIVGPTDPDKSDGLTDDDLAALAERSGVRFAGERTDMAAVYAAFDLFVLATHREGFPRAAMEATAMGLPVIATDIRGCRQVVDDGVTGRLVPVRDASALARAIGDLADDPVERTRMSRAGVRRASERFDQQHQIDLTLEVYERLLGRTPDARAEPKTTATAGSKASPGSSEPDSPDESVGARGRTRPSGSNPTEAVAEPVEPVEEPGWIPPGGRVLHLVTSDARRGAEIAAQELVDSLAEAGIDGSFFALAPADGDEADRLPIPTLGPSPRSPWTIREVRRLARSHDLVIAHGSDTLLVAALATFGTSTPFVYLMIGDPDVWGDVPLVRLRIGLPLRRAAAVVVLWPGAGRSIQGRYGISPERIEVIPNGRDPDQFRPSTDAERASARLRYGLENDSDAETGTEVGTDAGAGTEASADVEAVTGVSAEVVDAGPEPGPHVGAGLCPIIAWIGALSEEKRPELAVQVAAKLDGARLLMAGDGPLRSRVAALASDLDVDLQLLGVLPDVRELLWAADVLLLTSRTEGMPGVAVEALLCETPVAAPAVGALPDLLGDGHPGCFPANASAADIARAVEAVLGADLSPPMPVTTAEALDRWTTLLQQGPNGRIDHDLHRHRN